MINKKMGLKLAEKWGKGKEEGLVKVKQELEVKLEIK